MSLAWATVVVAILLTPGACFFAGLYIPQAVSRETVAISPLGQLAAIVFTSFFLHGIFYILINHAVVKVCPWMAPIDLKNFFPVLHVDNGSGSEVRSTSLALDSHITHIITYFFAVGFVGGFAGFLSGVAIENQLPFFWRLARHLWLYEIRGSSRALQKKETIIYVSALSKVQEDGQLVLYSGQLSNVYVKADGTISYMTLSSAASSILAVPTRIPAEATQVPTKNGLPFSPASLSRGVTWSLQQPKETDPKRGLQQDMLFLSGTEINNFYLERYGWQIKKSTRIRAAVQVGREQLKAAGIQDNVPGSSTTGGQPLAF